MSSYHHQLQRIRFLLRGSRLIGTLLSVTALTSALWLMFGLVDAIAAFESTARLSITVALITICAVVLLASLIRSFCVPEKNAASLADLTLVNPRHPVSAALSLVSAPAKSPLTDYLTKKTLDSAALALSAISAKQLIPWRSLGKALLAMLIPLFLMAALRFIWPQAFAIISSRLIHPATDIAPYSPLNFTLEPSKPSAIYGGEILISAEITGAKLTRSVEILIRQPRTGAMLRLPAFRESATRYSRKLNGLTEPVEIAFTSGKARSKWHLVDILLEPNILNGIVRIAPPAYTGLTESEFPLDTNEIAAMEGSSVTLELTSNRPLSSGNLILTPDTAAGSLMVTETFSASILSAQTASFTWTATRSGRISATLRDLLGTPSPRPLDLAFRTMPDLPPSVELSEPPAWILATPKSVISVTGRAQDDFALSRVHIVRTLSGFRDRSRIVAPALRDKSYDYADKLNLDELGLKAGQTIELMLDATDHNPSLLGQGSSELSRIQIISEDQYAEYIRARTTINEFANRFQAAYDAMNHARKALEELDRQAQLENNEPDPEALVDATKKAAEAQQDAAELLEKIADDFPAFDLEKRLQDLAREQAEDLHENALLLQTIKPDIHPEELRKEIDDMLERLGRQKDQLDELDDDVISIKQMATLLEMAARFRQIYDSQESITKRFGTTVEELRRGEDQNRRLLPSLAETQLKIRLTLDDFKIELRRRIDVLPQDDENLTPMIDSALKFLQEIDIAAPETSMDAATKHGKNGEAMDAFTNAERARATLERLMSEPEPFPEAAKCQAPKFNIPRLDVNKTLQQLLEALLKQNLGLGNGNQPGGMGLQGQLGGGFPMNLPVVGPERLRFSDAPNAGGSRSGEGKTAQIQPLPDTAEAGVLKPTESRNGNASAVTPESIPEPYREAVKRFLTP